MAEVTAGNADRDDDGERGQVVSELAHLSMLADRNTVARLKTQMIAAAASAAPESQKASLYLLEVRRLVRSLEQHDRLLVEWTRTLSSTQTSSSDNSVTSSSDNSVELSKLLKGGAGLGLVIFLVSLFTWAYADTPLINPYVSVLGLVACPFFYIMGRMVVKPAK
jgi:hypothetical protein